jgi:hypothetical protein
LRGRYDVIEDKSPKIIIKDACAVGVDRAIIALMRRGSSYHAGDQRMPCSSFEKESHNNFSSASLTIFINRLFGQSKRRTMKNKIFTFAVIGCMAGIFFAGCEKAPEQKVERANQELKDAKADYRAEWQKYKTDSEEQIKANEDRIDAFKAKMEKADRKTKAKYNKAVAELEQKNRDLKRRLEEYKDEGESKWQEFKTNFSHDMDGVGNTMKDLFKDND